MKGLRKVLALLLSVALLVMPNVVQAVETDTNGPVITVVACDKRNQTLYIGDSVKLTFSVEDPSGVRSNIGMLMTYVNSDGGGYSEFKGPACVYNSETGLYECVFTVNATHKVGKYTFAKLHAYDGVGNYSSVRPACSFFVDGTETDTSGPIITEVSCDKENEILYEGDSIKYTFKLEDPSGISSNVGMLMTYKDPDGGSYTEFKGPACIYNSETGSYECVFTVNATHKVGQYEFAKLHAYDQKGNESYIRPDKCFYVAGTETDTVGPVIIEVLCDKENETLYEGDSIKYTFKLEDPSGISSNIGMLMAYRNPDGDGYSEFKGPACVYNTETGLYECVFTVNATHKVGQYEFAKLHAYDQKGNESYIRPDKYFYIGIEETEHDCVDYDSDFWCDICGAWFVPCVDSDGDYWCDNCGDRIEHDCVDNDGNYTCDLCYTLLPHGCVDEDGDYYCDICWDPIVHDCEDNNSDYWCDLCGTCLPHDCLDEDSDYRCDICYDGIPHDCIDENNDYLCDLCASVLEHECADTDGDYLCDICDWWIPHDCVDQDVNYRCDICDDWIPHECVDENANYLCDLCNCVLDHPCFDENADYRCDVCLVMIEHDCIDGEGDYICDRCQWIIAHECTDSDDDYCCDLCYWPLDHRCVNNDGDYLCDLAGCKWRHDCVDQNDNFFCDICHYVMEHDCVDEDRDCWCDVFGCRQEWGWGPHATMDKDDDHHCDLCYQMIEHDCYDTNSDGLCDLCHQECSSEEVYLLGDISGDGKVNMGDVAKLYAHIKGTSILTDDTVLDRCDISGDGKVNMGDVAKLYAHIKGTNKLY